MSGEVFSTADRRAVATLRRLASEALYQTDCLVANAAWGYEDRLRYGLVLASARKMVAIAERGLRRYERAKAQEVPDAG